MKKTRTAPGAGALTLHRGERDAHDRGGQRGDDHGADDSGGGVGEHSRRRDDCREGEHRPERRSLGADVTRTKLEVVGEPLEGATLCFWKQPGS